MRSYKSIIITLALLLAVAVLSAWSITDTYFGNKIIAMGARNQAMGGIGVFDDMRPSGFSINPANLTLMDITVGLEGSALLNRDEDNRSVPLYNSFDAYIDDAVYVSNINFFYDYALAGFASYDVIENGRIGLGISHRPLLSFEGIYEEEIRNNRNTDYDRYAEKLAVNMIENKGTLNQFDNVLSLGYELGDEVSLNAGMAYLVLDGYAKSAKTIRWTPEAYNLLRENNISDPEDVLPDYTLTENVNYSGNRLKFGTAVRLNKILGFGVTYTEKTELDRKGKTREINEECLAWDASDESTDIDEKYLLPSELRVGFNYQPRNIMRTWFNMDVELVKWSQMGKNYDDQYNFYVGVEHHVTNRLPLRLGFNTVNSYFRSSELVTGDLDDNPSTPDETIMVYTPTKYISPAITAGSSVNISKSFTFDLAIAYTWREYQALDLFMDTYYDDTHYTGLNNEVLWPNTYIELKDRGWENPDQVRENIISLTTSLSFKW